MASSIKYALVSSLKFNIPITSLYQCCSPFMEIHKILFVSNLIYENKTWHAVARICQTDNSSRSYSQIWAIEFLKLDTIYHWKTKCSDCISGFSAIFDDND